MMSLKQPLVLLLAGSVLAGCSEDPSLFTGGPPGPPVEQRISSSRLTVVVGDSIALGARVQDEVGNTISGTVPTITSCDNNVVTVAAGPADPVYTANAWVRAVGLGVSCLAVSGGGLTDTVVVTTGPAAVRIFGPNTAATTDTVLSGSTAAFTVVAFARNGDTLTGTTEYQWTSSAVANMAIHRLTGEAAGKSPGTPLIRIRAPGGAMDQKQARVVAGIFSGTLSVATAAPGALVTVSRATDGPFFDGDTQVNLGTGATAFIDSWSTGTVTFAVPSTGATTAATLGLTNMGPGQVAQNGAGAFTPAAAFLDVHDPGNQSPATAPDYTAVRSASNWVYFSHSGYGTGAASRGLLQGSGGTQPDHYFLITTGASGGTIAEARLEWTNGSAASDFDIFVCPTNFAGDFDLCPAILLSAATTSEVGTNIPLLPNTEYFVAGSAWLAANNIHNFRLRLVGSGYN
jgi:hypothetical protein